MEQVSVYDGYWFYTVSLILLSVECQPHRISWKVFPSPLFTEDSAGLVLFLKSFMEFISKAIWDWIFFV